LPQKSLSEKYLTEARELLKEGDLVQAQLFKKALMENASQKFWGASALAVKRIGAKKGLKLEEHGGLWPFVNVLAMQRGDKDLTTFFSCSK